MKYLRFIPLSVITLAACGGPPANNPMLIESRSAYEAAVADASVLTHAPRVLKAAEVDLAKGEAALRAGEGDEVVSHYAYLAHQRVRIAHKRAEVGQAEIEVKEAEGERQGVLIQAREKEAAQAKAEAVEAQRDARTAEAQAQAATVVAVENAREAELAKEAARQALAQARALAERVAELEAQETERGLVLTLGDVLFDVGKANLKPGAERAINELATFLQEYPQRKILVEGFTDSSGDEQFNLRLSEERAAAVQAALVARGISSTRVATKGFGEAFPVATNGSAAGRQQNRRVEVIISDQTGVIPNRTQ